MQVPPFVRRATLRLIVGGVTLAVVTAAIGLVGERLRFGEHPDQTRAQIERDVRQRFTALESSLEIAVQQLRGDSAVAVISQTRDQGRTRQVFERLAAVEEALQIPEVAIASPVPTRCSSPRARSAFG
jgi:hypothetical protein